jgi:hypothetical protein
MRRGQHGAVANDLPVYTCNADDFDGIDGLEVVPVSTQFRTGGSRL